MKTSTLLAAITLSFATVGTALAQEATYELPQPVMSATTRAQVMADLQQARASGSLRITEADYQKPATFVAQRSRSDVKAETLAAIANGEVAALNSEQGTFDRMAGRASSEGARHLAKAAR